MRLIFLALLFLSVACASCRVPLDSSALAATEAGQSTLVLGSCQGTFNEGWANCFLERRSPLPFPVLQFVMTNAGEWAVGDCELGIYKTGSALAPGIIEVSLEGLHAQAERNKFCLLKIETVEKFNDSTGQTRSINIRGGFFIEMLEPTYMPTPAPADIAFCYKLERTSKGRTKLSACK